MFYECENKIEFLSVEEFGHAHNLCVLRCIFGLPACSEDGLV